MGDFNLFGAEQPGMLLIGPETDFAVPAGPYTFLRSLDNPGGLENLHRFVIEDESLRQTLHRRSMIPGFENSAGFHTLAPGATVTTRHYLSGFSDFLPDPSDYADAAHESTGYPLIWVIGTLLGGSVVENHSATITSGSTTLEIKVDDASGFVEGMLVTVNVAGAGDPAKWESGYVSEVDTVTDTLHLRQPLSQAPVEDDPMATPPVVRAVYGSVVNYDRSLLESSVTLRWVGHRAGADTPLYCTMIGCMPASATLNLSPRELPTIEVTWMVAAAAWDDDSAVGVSPQVWPYPAPEELVGQRFVFNDTEEHLINASIEIDNGLYQVQSPNAEFGVHTCVKTHQEITLSASVPYSGGLRQAFAAQHEFGVHIEWGSQPGKRIAIGVPAVSPGEFSGPTSEGGVAYASISLRSLEYVGDAGTHDESEPGNKSLAISFG